MIPEAPVRFSTMNCCLSASVSLAAKSRASGSTEPPGGYGETNLTVLVGHSCANAGNDRHSRINTLESHISSSFQLEHFASLVGGRDRKAQLLQYSFRLAHLLGVSLCELAAPEPQAVFEADSHVAAHHRRHGGDEHLVAPGAEHRPVVGVAEQAVRRALHVHHVLGVRADAAADAEHRLDEQRRLDQAPLEEVRAGVEVADV